MRLKQTTNQGSFFVLFCFDAIFPSNQHTQRILYKCICLMQKKRTPKLILKEYSKKKSQNKIMQLTHSKKDIHIAILCIFKKPQMLQKDDTTQSNPIHNLVILCQKKNKTLFLLTCYSLNQVFRISGTNTILRIKTLTVFIRDCCIF